MDEVVEFHHEPVLVDEVIEVLRPKSGGNYLDGTLGGATAFSLGQVLRHTIQ